MPNVLISELDPSPALIGTDLFLVQHAAGPPADYCTLTQIATAASTSLGLGTMATQNANAVAITGGAIAGTSVAATSLSASGQATLATTNVGGLTSTSLTVTPGGAGILGTTQVGSLISTGLLNISGAAAGQISFPATQNASSGANVLDDYEEGVWTGTVSSSVGTITTATGAGNYTKIGNRWLISLLITITDNGTGSTSLRCTLPASTTVGTTLSGRDNGVSGKTITATVGAASATAIMFNYDNSYPGSTGAAITMSGTFM